MLSYVILRTVVLSYTRRESRYFKLANIPSGRNVIGFQDKAAVKRYHSLSQIMNLMEYLSTGHFRIPGTRLELACK